MQYRALGLVILILFLGVKQFYFPRNEIEGKNELNKFQLSPNNILIKLKIFKYNSRFNYFILIPYLFSWILFVFVFILYILAWAGISTIIIILGSKILSVVLSVILIVLLGYHATIQQVIRLCAETDFRFSKEKTEEQGFMRSNFEYSAKEDIEKDNQKQDKTKDERNNSSSC